MLHSRKMMKYHKYSKITLTGFFVVPIEFLAEVERIYRS
jgi:hypothetical protein